MISLALVIRRFIRCNLTIKICNYFQSTFLKKMSFETQEIVANIYNILLPITDSISSTGCQNFSHNWQSLKTVAYKKKPRTEARFWG
jgi:hypothetical protein